MARRRLLPALPLLVALGAAPACGLNIGDSWTSVEEADDVTTWYAGGPVVLCEAGESVRLGRPDSRAAGFCVEELPATPCVYDDQCRSRERCVCGTCEVLYCDATDDCPGEWDICNFAEHRCDRSCHGDDQCAAGERCEPGLDVCRARCAADAECQAGEVCEDGLCAVSPGRSGPCATDADCATHPHCALQRRPADLREPCIVEEDYHQVLYVERVEGAVSAIWRATSFGRGFRFTPGSPVVVPGFDEARRAGAPSVITDYSRGAMLIVFADGAGRLRLARPGAGGDGRFVIDPKPLVVPSGSWQSAGLDSPSLVKTPFPGLGDSLLYFGTRDRRAIGLAVGSVWGDGASFEALPDPVLQVADVADPKLWRDVDRLGAPSAVAIPSALGGREPPTIRLYFEAHGRESEDAVQLGAPVREVPNDSIGAAASTDGIHFVRWPWNPVFDRVLQFLDHTSEQQPSVLSEYGDQVMFYRAASADGRRSDNLRVAYNSRFR